MPKYIKREKAYELARTNDYYSDFHKSMADLTSLKELLDDTPSADVVEVVRCKNCKWFVPKHIKLNDGTKRAYTEEEKKLPLGVTGDIGINCGSRCLRCLRWEENSIPVYVQENDFCSYGERSESA